MTIDTSIDTSNVRGVFPKRTIHLDFHTGPAVPDIARDFDPEEFAKVLVGAHVDSVTLFAKCHHGLLYFDTDRPERHPGLPRDRHLLEDQVAALHAHGIQTPIYVSVGCDEYAANAHPDWVAMDGLSQVKWGDAFTAGWQIMDLSSPYQDYVAEQVQEVIDRFAPLDGLFLDMLWDQPSSSKWARAGMIGAGLNPADPADRATYARLRVRQFMERFSAMAEPYFNPDVVGGVWFNSRPKTALGEEKKYLHHVEIEALPTGGWGYSYFPYVARYVRPLGLPTLSHTARFFKSWGDNGGLKPEAALRFETANILAQGMTLGIGDLMPPSGRLDPVVWGLIGRVYAHAQACEPYLEGTRVAAEAALVVDTALGDAPGPSGIGAMRALLRSRTQFDVVGPGADFNAYTLLVVPESTPLDETLVGRLGAYLARGGHVLLAREYDQDRDDCVALAKLGVAADGPLPVRHMFLRADPSLGTVEYDHVIYQTGIAVRAPGWQVMCRLVEPYFARTWDRFSGHSYTPSSGVVSGWPAVVARDGLIVCAVPLLKSIATEGAPYFTDLAGGLISRLLPRPMVKVGGPAHVEATLATGPTRLVLHVVSYLSTRVTEGLDYDPAGAGELLPTPIDLVQDPFPLIDVPIAIRVDDRRVTGVHTQPDGNALAWEVADGYLTTTLTCLDGHTMIVVDLEDER